MPYQFRLLHISDMHFGAEPYRLPSIIQAPLENIRGRFPPGTADQFVTSWARPATHCGWASEHLARYIGEVLIPGLQPDAIVVTGDLAATGDRRDLAVAHQFFTEEPARYWASASGSPCIGQASHIAVMLPGNHDRYVGALALPGGREFDAVFAAQWQPTGASGCVTLKRLPSPEDGELVIASLDCSLRDAADGSPPYGYGYIGTGRVYQDIVDDLVAQVAAVREVANICGVVVALHFPPSYPAVDSKLRLHNEAALLDAFEELGVSAVLAGHTHKQALYPLDGGISVNCVGSATQADRESRYHFAVCGLDVSNGRVTSKKIVNFEFDESKFDFIEGDARDF